MVYIIWLIGFGSGYFTHSENFPAAYLLMLAAVALIQIGFHPKGRWWR
jgi:hypothetical protein